MPSAALRRLSPLQWAGLDLGLCAVALLLLGVGVPASPFFFPLLSLWACLVLFVLAVCVLRTAGVELGFFHWAVVFGIWAVAVVYFYWTLSSRSFIYVWDYANYLLKQYDAEAAFAQSTGGGLRYLFGSMADDYTNFITLFTEFPFCLTDHTGDAYSFSQVFCILPTLLVLLAGLVVKVGQLLNVKNRMYYFLFGLTLTAAYPFLRMSAVLAQPDWFGLIFAFAILLLTLDFRFDTLEPARFGLIFLATAAIILARRWFLYFVVGYYFAYVLLLVAGCVRLAKDGAVSAALRRGKNLILFGLASVAAMVILLWPMVSHILTYNYAGRYSYYNGGGLALEAFYHLGRLGLFNLILIALGLVFAAKRKLPALPCLAGCELVVSLLLFTRVQNTGSHQFLLFLPGYFLLFLLGAAALAEGIQRHRTLKLGCWAFVLMLSMSVRCSPLTTLAMPGFVIEHFPIQIPATRYFISLDKLIYDRKDIGQIQAIADWIDAHCDAGAISYMIPHDMLYNPDHFKNCRLPDAPINDKLAFGFSVPGTHNFPMQFFEAKYVITCDPFPQTYAGSGEMSIKLNERFLAAKDDAFTFEQSFDMGNGTTFTIWRRTAAPTRAEVEYYLSAFAAEDAQYPEMFSQVAEAWLTAHGL